MSFEESRGSFLEKYFSIDEPYKYPQGKSRLEPLGIVVVACAMGMAGLQVIIQSVQELLSGARDIDMGVLPVTVLAVTIGCKLLLYITCHIILLKISSPSVAALRDDHRNDFVNNCFSLAAALIADRLRFLWFFDPAGALILSVYIVFNWYHNGKNQIASLIGKTAPSDFISQIVYMAAHASPHILRVDSVQAYHYGMAFMVECHIILDEYTILRTAHDIAENLERQIEKLDLVEKCFIHLDYEWTHKPKITHRRKGTQRKLDTPSRENSLNSMELTSSEFASSSLNNSIAQEDDK